jgi:hypothetical protein
MSVQWLSTNLPGAHGEDFTGLEAETPLMDARVYRDLSAASPDRAWVWRVAESSIRVSGGRASGKRRAMAEAEDAWTNHQAK